MKTIVIYASKMGSTRKVAEYIAGKIDSGSVDLKADPNPDVSGFDRIILGTGVYASRTSKRLDAFIKGADLSGKDVRVFVCCKLSGEKGDKQIKQISEKFGFPAVYFAGKDKDAPSSAIDGFIAGL